MQSAPKVRYLTPLWGFTEDICAACARDLRFIWDDGGLPVHRGMHRLVVIVNGKRLQFQVEEGTVAAPGSAEYDSVIDRIAHHVNRSLGPVRIH